MTAMPPIQPAAATGRFLTTTVEPADVLTREDLSDEQRLFGRAALEFMRGEVLPREAQICAHDWALTRALLRKAGELDLLRLEIPEAYGGLGLDTVTSPTPSSPRDDTPSKSGHLVI